MSVHPLVRWPCVSLFVSCYFLTKNMDVFKGKKSLNDIIIIDGVAASDVPARHLFFFTVFFFFFFLLHHHRFQYGFKNDTCSGLSNLTSNREAADAYLWCVREYRQDAICQEPNGPMKNSDHTMLVTGQKFSKFDDMEVLGLAYYYHICHWAKSVR